MLSSTSSKHSPGGPRTTDSLTFLAQRCPPQFTIPAVPPPLPAPPFLRPITMAQYPVPTHNLPGPARVLGQVPSPPPTVGLPPTPPNAGSPPRSPPRISSPTSRSSESSAQPHEQRYAEQMPPYGSQTRVSHGHPINTHQRHSPMRVRMTAPPRGPPTNFEAPRPPTPFQHGQPPPDEENHEPDHRSPPQPPLNHSTRATPPRTNGMPPSGARLGSGQDHHPSSNGYTAGANIPRSRNIRRGQPLPPRRLSTTELQSPRLIIPPFPMPPMDRLGDYITPQTEPAAYIYTSSVSSTSPFSAAYSTTPPFSINYDTNNISSAPSSALPAAQMSSPTNYTHTTPLSQVSCDSNAIPDLPIATGGPPPLCPPLPCTGPTLKAYGILISCDNCCKRRARIEETWEKAQRGNQMINFVCRERGQVVIRRVIWKSLPTCQLEALFWHTATPPTGPQPKQPPMGTTQAIQNTNSHNSGSANTMTTNNANYIGGRVSHSRASSQSSNGSRRRRANSGSSSSSSSSSDDESDPDGSEESDSNSVASRRRRRRLAFVPRAIAPKRTRTPEDNDTPPNGSSCSDATTNGMDVKRPRTQELTVPGATALETASGSTSGNGYGIVGHPDRMRRVQMTPSPSGSSAVSSGSSSASAAARERQQRQRRHQPPSSASWSPSTRQQWGEQRPHAPQTQSTLSEYHCSQYSDPPRSRTPPRSMIPASGRGNSSAASSPPTMGNYPFFEQQAPTSPQQRSPIQPHSPIQARSPEQGRTISAIGSAPSRSELPVPVPPAATSAVITGESPSAVAGNPNIPWQEVGPEGRRRIDQEMETRSRVHMKRYEERRAAEWEERKRILREARLTMDRATYAQLQREMARTERLLVSRGWADPDPLFPPGPTIMTHDSSTGVTSSLGIDLALGSSQSDGLISGGNTSLHQSISVQAHQTATGSSIEAVAVQSHQTPTASSSSLQAIGVQSHQTATSSSQQAIAVQSHETTTGSSSSSSFRAVAVQSNQTATGSSQQAFGFELHQETAGTSSSSHNNSNDQANDH